MEKEMANHPVTLLKNPMDRGAAFLIPSSSGLPGIGSARGTQLRHLDVQPLGISRLVERGLLFCFFFAALRS